MLERLVKLVAEGYGLLLGVAAGGFVGANFAGLVAGSIQFATAGNRAPDPQIALWWTHCGWVVGAGLFFAAGVAHEWRKVRKRSSGNHEDRPADGKARSTKWTRRWRKRSKNSNRFRATIDGKECGILGSIGVGSLGGALLGLFLGGSLLLLWFSLTYSPFAPQESVASLSLEEKRTGDTGRKRTVVATDHPTAMYALFGPIVLGAVGGGLFGGVGTTIQTFRDSAARRDNRSED